MFLYFEDGFQKPAPFRPDIASPIDDVVDKKVDALDAHVSQVYEWLPWHDWHARSGAEGSGGTKGLAEEARAAAEISPRFAKPLGKWYGADAAKKVQVAEAFEICEYGARPDEAMLRKLFPFTTAAR